MKALSEFHKNKAEKSGYCPDCKDCRRKRAIKYYHSSPDVRNRVAENSKRYHNTHKELVRLQHRIRRGKILQDIFNSLGNKCSLCDALDKRILQIDHINGGGGKQRKSINYSSWKFYKIVKDSIRNNKKEFRLLCANCNILEAIKKGYKKSQWG